MPPVASAASDWPDTSPRSCLASSGRLQVTRIERPSTFAARFEPEPGDEVGRVVDPLSAGGIRRRVLDGQGPLVA